MLKNKTTLGLLLLVVIIWGIIGYKIYSQMTDDAVVNIREIQPQDTYSDSVDESMHLAFSYTDPFLKDVTVKRVESQPRITKVVKSDKMPVVTKSVPVINWSLVKYYGLMSNASRAVKTGIVRFDNEDFFVREGDHVDIFTVLDVRTDSIKLGYDNLIRYIRKQN